jgi:hypothetical protein
MVEFNRRTLFSANIICLIVGQAREATFACENVCENAMLIQQ